MNYRVILAGKLNRITLGNIAKSKFNQDVLWNIFSLGILAVGGIIISLIIAKLRGPEALGIFNQVFAFYIVLSQIGVGGLQFSVLKNISYNQGSPIACADITIVALIIVAIISGVIAWGCFVLAGWVAKLLDSPDVGLGLRLITPGLIFFSLNKVLVMALNGLRQMKAYAVFRALRFILIPIGIIIIIWLGRPNAYLALSLTLTEVILFVGLVIYVNARLFFIKAPANFRQWFHAHLSFGARGVLSGVLIELNTRVDIIMLGYFSTDAMVGVYSFAAILAEGFSQIPLVLRWNVDPIIGRYFSEGHKEQISVLAGKIKRVFYPVMGLIGVLAILLYPVLLQLWMPETAVIVSWGVFVLIIVGVVLNAGYRPFGGIMLQGGRPGSYTLFVGGMVLSNVVLNIALIPILGIYGAAVATAVVYVLEAILIVISAKKLFGIQL
ncbi:MAG: oligosaccharide flippase family protein [Deltaproteobacteria bacterium]|nr:oligosaccharide flippase family protein [Deltaproteobacteria bacterium]